MSMHSELVAQALSASRERYLSSPGLKDHSEDTTAINIHVAAFREVASQLPSYRQQLYRQAICCEMRELVESYAVLAEVEARGKQAMQTAQAILKRERDRQRLRV